MRKSVLLLLVSGLMFSAFARIEPSALFTDHAVLLRSSDTPVFGFAEPGEKVSVALGAASASAVADAHGAWLVRLDLRDAPKKSQSLVMNDMRAEDVLVGEVWLCSGQSNMSFTLESADDSESENAQSNTEIRCFNVDVRCRLKPDRRIAGRWLRDVPKEKLAFSAIGYHFAKRLQAGLGVPVGIVNSSVGASTLEAWCDPDALSAFPEGKRCLDGQIAFMADYRNYERRCQSALRTWERKWGRADRPHEAAPTNGWRALTQSERDSFRHGPGAIWFRRKMAPTPKGLVVSRKRFIERQWRFDDSAAEFYFNGRRFCFANTHTDNVSEKAREEGVKLIVRRMRDCADGLPIVLVGDHNNQENESPSRYLAQVMDNALYKSETSPSGPWRTWNGWRELAKEVTCTEALRLPLAVRNIGWDDKAASGESAAFRARSMGPRIDYIWVSRDVRVRDYATHADLRPGCSHYPSDHFPVTAEVMF